jgi:hypothetical protein
LPSERGGVGSRAFVADRRLNDTDHATRDDTKQREVSASGDVVEAALAKALGEASAAGRFDVVALLASELQARRLARDGVVVLGAQRRQRRTQETVAHSSRRGTLLIRLARLGT